MSAPPLSPEPDRAPRLATLDVLRGLAILGILFMNVNEMGASIWASFELPRHIGWTACDRTAWALRQVLAEGTARALLELLFGAGLAILTDRLERQVDALGTMAAYYARNLVLAGFGLVHMLVLLWPGDILHTYGVAALIAFWGRRLRVRWLLMLGASFALLNLAGAAMPDDPARSHAERLLVVRNIAVEDRARSAATGDIASWAGSAWMSSERLIPIEPESIAEATATMLLGVALFRLGVVQGRRSRRFYAAMLVAGYALGLAIRASDVAIVLADGRPPAWLDGLYEFGRLAMAAGHLALVVLLMQTGAGRRLLRPFAAAGRVALSLYILQSLVCLWLIFPPFGLGLYGRFGWAGLMGVAAAVDAVLLVMALVYLRHFAIGPVEWAWRSVVEQRRLPWRAR